MIEFLPLKRITALHATALRQAVQQAVDSGWYLRGPYTRRFEESYAAYIGTHHCTACGNGLDALTLIFRAYMEMGIMEPGDEVIVPANTYIASMLAVTECGLRPVPVEPRLDTLQLDDSLIEQAITDRTRAIMIVHLYGRCAYTPRIGELCQRYRLRLIEDNAQAHGCTFDGRRTGSLGHAAGHSFYPTKNLGALGDAGAVTTDDKELADIVRTLANYGSRQQYVFERKGRNSRMDELQAAVLCEKLRFLEEDNRHRQTVARYYAQHISHPLVTLPIPSSATPGGNSQSVYHLFPVLCPERDALRIHLEEQGIGTQIHYPIPPHRQACYRQELGHLRLPLTELIHQQILSLPCHPALSREEAEAVVEAVNNYPT